MSITISMDDIRNASRSAGSRWFEAAAMRFFRTRLAQTGTQDSAGRIWFITSDAPHGGARRYSVRVYIPETGNVETYGAFHSHATRAAAQKAMKFAIATGFDPCAEPFCPHI